MIKAKIVGLTKALEMDVSTGEFVAYCARVSNPANQENHETSPKLLRYLQRKAHWSPFEMASATIRIETTRDIARQILRHRSFSFQEFSQRYAEVTDFRLSSARRQDFKNRQNSIDDLDDIVKEDWEASQKLVIDAAINAYQSALAAGVAKECARKVLPEGLTVSTLFMAGTLRSYIHYLEQRMHESTQLEHREVALAVQEELARHIPEIFSR